MTEPGYRQVPGDDPPDYNPADEVWQEATAEYAEALYQQAKAEEQGDDDGK